MCKSLIKTGCLLIQDRVRIQEKKKESIADANKRLNWVELIEETTLNKVLLKEVQLSEVRIRERKEIQL